MEVELAALQERRSRIDALTYEEGVPMGGSDNQAAYIFSLIPQASLTTHAAAAPIASQRARSVARWLISSTTPPHADGSQSLPPVHPSCRPP